MSYHYQRLPSLRVSSPPGLNLTPGWVGWLCRGPIALLKGWEEIFPAKDPKHDYLGMGAKFTLLQYYWGWNLLYKVSHLLFTPLSIRLWRIWTDLIRIRIPIFMIMRIQIRIVITVVKKNTVQFFNIFMRYEGGYARNGGGVSDEEGEVRDHCWWTRDELGGRRGEVWRRSEGVVVAKVDSFFFFFSFAKYKTVRNKSLFWRVSIVSRNMN